MAANISQVASTTLSNVASNISQSAYVVLSNAAPTISLVGGIQTHLEGPASKMDMTTTGLKSEVFGAGSLCNFVSNPTGSLCNIAPFTGLVGTTETYVSGSSGSMKLNSAGIAVTTNGTYSNAAATINEFATGAYSNTAQTIQMQAGTSLSNIAPTIAMQADNGNTLMSLNSSGIKSTVGANSTFDVSVTGSHNPVFSVGSNSVTIKGNMNITGVIETQNTYTSNYSLTVEDRALYLGVNPELTNFNAIALSNNSNAWIVDSNQAADPDWQFGRSNGPPGIILAGLPTGVPQYQYDSNNEFFLGKSFAWNYNQGNSSNIGSNLATINPEPKESFWEVKGGSFRITQPVNYATDANGNVLDTTSNISYHFRINGQSELEIVKVTQVGHTGSPVYARVAKFGRTF